MSTSQFSVCYAHTRVYIVQNTNTELYITWIIECFNYPSFKLTAKRLIVQKSLKYTSMILFLVVACNVHKNGFHLSAIWENTALV